MRKLITAGMWLWILIITILFSSPVASMDFAVDWSAGYQDIQACERRQNATLLFCVGSHEAGRSATLRARFRLSDALIGDDHGVQRIWLAGASGLPGTPPDIWGLSWAQDPLSWRLIEGKWVAVWRLELHTQLDETAAIHTIELAQPVPDADHIYEILAAYDASTGYVSLRLQDLTIRRVVYAGDVQVQPHDKSFWYTAGYAGAVNPTLQGTDVIDGIAVVPTYIPVGVTWHVGGADANATAETAHFAYDSPISISLKALGANGADFRLRVPNNNATSIYQFPQGALPATLTLDAGALPPGKSRLLLEYAPQGEVLGVTSYDVTVGKADVHIHQLRKTAETLTSTMQVDVDQYLPTLDVSLSAHVFRLNWDSETKLYTEDLVLSSDTTVQLTDLTPGRPAMAPIAIDAPADAGYYRIELKVEAGSGIFLAAQGTEQWFHTFQAATTQPGSPFTIAVLPDTQAYARYYPEVLTRQTEWLAANAQELGLGLVLHLGDVTDRNTAAEWANVSHAFSLLDDVVPYVLAIGNHDLCVNGQYVLERNAGKAHLYFPPERFPTLHGMYEPGRIDNAYHLLELGGEKYLILALEYGPRDGVLEWADRVASTYADHKMIVVTHNYLTPRGERHVNGPHTTDLATHFGAVNDAQGIWYKFARRHKHLFMILSGHMVSPTVPRRVDVGMHMNLVFELLSDYSSIGRGGDGWLVIYQFNPNQRVKVWVYSPYLDSHKNDVDDYGFNCTFEIDLVRGTYTAY
ncbi:MAG: metallophosphoesterase [Limnochordia bacterium]|jgi:hypothetical protein